MATKRSVALFGLVLLAAAIPVGRVEAKKVAMPRRYTFEIDANTPIKDLLPIRPKVILLPPNQLNDDLAKVPQVDFGAPLLHDAWIKALSKKDAKIDKANINSEELAAHLVARINHMNKKDPDGFLKELLAARADLRGMPFMMGDDCKMEGKSASLFNEVVQNVQLIRQLSDARRGMAPIDIWKDLPTLLSKKGGTFNGQPIPAASPDTPRGKATQAEIDRMAVVALTQMMGPSSETDRLGLVGYLASVEQAESTRALAKIALYAAEEGIRKSAIDALKKRPSKDYVDTLVQGLRYPLAAVAQRASDALVALKADDALPAMVDVLEQPDPRAPVTVKGQSFVRELVRVNHHRNCLLCHAPANTRGVPQDIITAPIALPDMELMTGSRGYGFGSSPDIFIRTDVTYLRQDFSMMMKVDNAKPWPEMQRFDFFVRTRHLTPEEAADCEKQLATVKTPPSHAAAQYALRSLTGQEPADPTPQTWRRILAERK